MPKNECSEIMYDIRAKTRFFLF